MATKEEVLAALARIPEGEPLFLLRGQDALAEDAVRHWGARALVKGVDPSKCQGALEIADQMKAWPDKKLPD